MEIKKVGMNKKFKSIGILEILLIVVIVTSLFFIFDFLLFDLSLLDFLNEQEKEFSTKLNCSQIKECIELEISCVDKFVENNLLGFKWSFSAKAFLSEQKEYYRLNCMEFLNDGKQ